MAATKTWPLYAVLWLNALSVLPIAAAQGTAEQTLAGKWRVRLLKPNGTVKSVEWDVKARDDRFEARQGDFTFTFAKGGDGPDSTALRFTCSLEGVGKVSEGKCTLNQDGSRFEGEIADTSGPRRIWTATRADTPQRLPQGLYLQAGEADVRPNQTVSIPIYLRYNGDGGDVPARAVADHGGAGHGGNGGAANMNFEMTYQANVATVLPHPQRERVSPSTKTSEAPDVPRGNLLARGVLIAGNNKKREIVLVGFAGKANVKPGTGKKHGETVTEIYFQAVGQPGDETELALSVTKINDPEGHEVPISTVSGRIRIIGGDLPTGPTCPKNPGNRPTPLDAYKALLMSIGRLGEDRYLDVSKDGKLTAQDATLILQMAGQSTGELAGGPDCSGGTGGGPLVPPPETAGSQPGGGHVAGGGPGNGHGPGPGPRDPHGLTPLDAYKALLMSIGRLPEDKQKYDLNTDRQVTSRDSVMILQESRRAIGE